MRSAFVVFSSHRCSDRAYKLHLFDTITGLKLLPLLLYSFSGLTLCCFSVSPSRFVLTTDASVPDLRDNLKFIHSGFDYFTPSPISTLWIFLCSIYIEQVCKNPCQVHHRRHCLCNIFDRACWENFAGCWIAYYRSRFRSPSQQIREIAAFLRHAPGSSVRILRFRLTFISKLAVRRQMFRKPCRRHRCKRKYDWWCLDEQDNTQHAQTCQILKIRIESPKVKNIRQSLQLHANAGWITRDGVTRSQYLKHHTCAAMTRKTIFLLVSCCSPQSNTSSSI